MAKKTSTMEIVANPTFGKIVINLETIQNWVAEEKAQRNHDVAETAERSVCCVTGGEKAPDVWVSKEAFRAAQDEVEGGGQMLVDLIKATYAELGGDLRETEGFAELVEMIQKYLGEVNLKAQEDEVLAVAREVMGGDQNWTELEGAFAPAFRKAKRVLKAVMMRERYEAKMAARPIAEQHYREYPADLAKKVGDIVSQVLEQVEGIPEGAMKSALWEVQVELNKVRPEHAQVVAEKYFRDNPNDIFRPVRKIADEIAPANDPGLRQLIKNALYHEKERLKDARVQQKEADIARHEEVAKTWFGMNRSNEEKIKLASRIIGEKGDTTLKMILMIPAVEKFRVRDVDEAWEARKDAFVQSFGVGSGLSKFSTGSKTQRDKEAGRTARREQNKQVRAEENRQRTSAVGKKGK